jgi:hypothetical protein
MTKDNMAKLIERGIVIKRIEAKETTQQIGSLQLGLSIRQVRRLCKRYRTEGVQGLTHKNFGRPNGRKVSQETELQAIAWLQEHGTDFGSTFAQEKLKEYLGIDVSVGTVRTWRIRNGIFKPRRRSDKKQFKRRERKHYFGIMVQVDGSPHDWFEGRRERCTLLTAIDDATGIIHAQFAQEETTVDLMRLMWQYIDKYGRPHIVYSDHGGPYKVSTGNADGHKKTQLGRALSELGIEIINANSPQAKGRVERNHSTNQDRLIKEMRLRNISTIEAANRYLQEEYLPQFNTRFVVKPAKSHDAHRAAKHFNLNQIFSIQEKRIVQNDGIVQFENLLLQITKNRIYAKAKSTVTVRVHLDGKITLWMDTIKLGYEQVASRPIAQPVVKNANLRAPVSLASMAWNQGLWVPNNLEGSRVKPAGGTEVPKADILV